MAKKDFSGYAFSFPTTPIYEDYDIEFKFCVSVAPDSPAADRIFLNGNLTPHEFRIQPSILPVRRTNSYTSSSSSSRDSLHSWRSSSIGSSSARSDNSEQRLFHQSKFPNIVQRNGRCRGQRPSLSSSSRRWQFIAPMPTLDRDQAASRRKKSVDEGSRSRKNLSREDDSSGGEASSLGLWKTLLRSFLSTCKQCHALEPRRVRRDDDFMLCWIG